MVRRVYGPIRAAPGALIERVFARVTRMAVDELGVPLHDVTFTVLDLETTGGSPASCGITEIGAVRYRGGEPVGSFHTLVNPGVAIPAPVTALTGITEAMVAAAPAIDGVVPMLAEFLTGSVMVGHNVRFDASFLDAAFVAHGYDGLVTPCVDTLLLARRLVRDEVPDCRLGTLARHFGTSVTPTHRAFDDARATAELLHLLFERAATFGVLGLDDLLALPTIKAHRSVGKLGLTARLPRGPGVYVFRDRAGRALRVGSAANVRAHVRAYFGPGYRKEVPLLLLQTTAIEHIAHAHQDEAAAHAARLLDEHRPRFNPRTGSQRRRAARET
jgi:DNA polymerase-3 subunit epsilon